MRSASPRGYGAFPGGNANAHAHAAAAPPSSPMAAGPPSAPRAAALFSRIRDQSRALVTSQRPWGQLLDTAALARPSSSGETLTRLRRNLGYFRANYAISLLGALTLGLIWQPGTMFAALVLAAAWFFLYLSREGPLVVFERRFEERTVLGALCVATFFALFSTDLGSNVFKSIAIGLVLVAIHAAFRVTDDLFLDESEAVSDGLVAGLAVPKQPTYLVRVV
ncbi:PRA1 family protein E-like [Canna indica]|uniref:PRA1 family protein n=1 Tax=Canna indica TaxID=4628 RepID=A0AAQ3JM71_9LILI|nr:PRA1 family protein E-like [Canna indica]